MTDGPWSRGVAALRGVLNDAFYRGSLLLLMNTAVLSVFGFAFWTLAARTYAASAVGAFSGVTSAVGLLAAVAALGWPNTITRHLASATNGADLVLVAISAIATLGGALSLATLLAFGPYLPSGLHLQQRGGTALLVTGLVIFTAVSGTIDAGLIATRASHAVLIKNLAGSVVRIVALFLLAGLGSTGLLIAYSLGVALSTGLSSLALARRVWGQRPSLRSLGLLRGHLSLTAGNYLATIMGILPTTVVPLEVLVIRGAAETARFAIAFLIAGFLNVIPSTVATVLFAEASRQGVTLGKQLRKSLRGIYGLLLPAVIVVLAAAPLVLRLFGAAYAATATGCLRVLALSALLTGGTYLVDSLLIARDRIAAYIFMNGANAALVLGCVGALLSRGLTAAAGGWALAQGVSLLLGLIVLATGGAGRHRVPAGAPAEDQDPLRMPESGWPAGHVIDLAEPRIRELLATWPAMPTTMIAQRIGWDESLPVLLDRVSELRSSYLRSGQLLSRTKMPPGEIAQCAFWFPPVDVPVGFGQVRAATQLPVLTLITGYSRWLSAMLIPSRQAGDLFEAWWHLLAQLGAVPRVLAWGNEEAVGQWRREGTDLTPECAAFCRALGAEVVIGRRADPHTRGIVERAHVYLERSFLPGRSFASPANFNAQLHDWLTAANTRHRRPPTRSPAELIEADLEWMLPLPPNAPATGWHVPMVVGRTPFILFETNKYSVHRAALGRQVEVVADLAHVMVYCGGYLVADHERIWARGQTVRDPAHDSAAGLPPPGRADL